ncbi:MAG: hypothetical protein OHK0039_32000 [Bacteroidia bacterium]
MLGLGLTVLLLLFFADKTILTNDVNAGIGQPGTGGVSDDIAAKLPPLAPDPDMDPLLARLDEADPGATVLLDSIITGLEGRNRLDFAAEYAARQARLDSSFSVWVRAGRLNHAASGLFYVQQDSVLFRHFSDRAIDLLSRANALRPQDEPTLLLLGLAYIESRRSENSMKGILTIRQVLDINPDNVEASLQLGRFSIQTGQFDKAEARFRTVLRLDPRNEAAQVQLAAALAGQDKHSEARSTLETLLENTVDPDIQRKATELLNSLPQ